MSKSAYKRKEQIGDCTLYLGDCLEVMPTLGGVDAVVTDPPYGVNLTAKVTKHKKITASHNYRDTPEHVLPMVTEAIRLAMLLAPCALVTSGNRLLQDYPKATSIGTIFAANGAGRDRWGFTGNNPILYYGSCPYLRHGLGSRPNSFYSALPGMPATGENTIDHPCPKPIAWMDWLVKRASPFSGETILDPFMGSGTTGVACVKLGRKFIGIELDEKYFDIACKRIEEAYKQPNLFIEPPAKAVQGTLL
jgi:DNA modification methylase